MQSDVPHYRRLLSDALAGRIEKNPRYSLRAFATLLGVEASALSKILTGRRQISVKLADRIADRLQLTPVERERLLASIAREKLASGLTRINPELRRKAADPRGAAAVPVTRDLNPDVFRVIADWYHNAMLELSQVRGFQSDARWIARRLGITQVEAKLAIDRLVALDLLERTPNGLRKTQAWIDTAGKSRSSVAHRRRQKQILEKSTEALLTVPIEARVHAGMTVPIDPAKIEYARKRISEFLLELGNELSAGQKEKVYELTVNLFPLEAKHENE